MAVIRHGPDRERHVRDIGPAAAAVDGLIAMGRISALGVRSDIVPDAQAHAQGAGPIERRRLTPDELAARTAPPATRPPIHVHRRPIPRTEEDPMPTPTAPPALPCGTCVHEPVCSLKSLLEAGELRPLTVLATGLRVVATGYRIECDHHMIAGWSPSHSKPIVQTPEQIQASRRRGGAATKAIHEQRREQPVAADEKPRYPLPRDRAERDRLVLEAIRATATIEEAGERLGVSGARVRQVVGEIRILGRLPGDVDRLLSERGRLHGPVRLEELELPAVPA